MENALQSYLSHEYLRTYRKTLAVYCEDVGKAQVIGYDTSHQLLVRSLSLSLSLVLQSNKAITKPNLRIDVYPEARDSGSVKPAWCIQHDWITVP